MTNTRNPLAAALALSMLATLWVPTLSMPANARASHFPAAAPMALAVHTTLA